VQHELDNLSVWVAYSGGKRNEGTMLLLLLLLSFRACLLIEKWIRPEHDIWVDSFSVVGDHFPMLQIMIFNIIQKYVVVLIEI
jgi:hypothetical protein